jgi:protein TonB
MALPPVAATNRLKMILKIGEGWVLEGDRAVKKNRGERRCGDRGDHSVAAESRPTPCYESACRGARWLDRDAAFPYNLILKVIFTAGRRGSRARGTFTQSLGTQTVAAGTLSAAPAARTVDGDAGLLLAGGDAAIALPPGLAARAFVPAWAIAIALHFALVGVAMVRPSAPPPEPPPIRLVFVEPPPPPPAPLGAANGAGSIAAVPEPEPIAKAPEPVQEPSKPVESDGHRLVRSDVTAKPKPKPKPRPRPQAKPAEESARELVAADVAPGVAAGSASGQAGGTVGGVEGGVAGGVVGGTGSGPVPVGQVANPPTLVRRVSPVYPEEARRRDIEGLVLLEAILDRDGTIEPGIKVLRSIPLLDAEAVAAVRQWRFRPARDAGGQALRVILEIPIRFVLR